MSSSTKPTTGIEDLPVEMISELFVHLPPKDLIVCSMVNKSWNSIYTAFKLHKLFVDEDRYLEHLKWFDSNRAVREAEQLYDLEMFGRLVEKPLLSNLKYLALIGSLKFDLNELNRFQQLVHLEIDTCSNRKKKLHLNLPKLKVLVFIGWNEDYSMSIDCPLLSTLVYSGREDAHLLEVRQPETIQKLVTDIIGLELAPFENVECLVTRRFEAISQVTLLSLPKLKELNYSTYPMFGNRPYSVLDRMKRTLGEFLDDVTRLRGNDFRFSFSGFQLTSMMLGQMDFGVQVDEEEDLLKTVSSEYLYMKNYHLVEPGAIDFFRRVNYSRLLSSVTGEFPRCFSQKFTNIRSVDASTKVLDVDHFLWFLKSLKSLRTLDLANTGLGQEFYDQLPAAAHLLNELRLSEGHCEDGLQLNFDFIDQIFLSNLIIVPALSFESLPSLVKWLGRLEEGGFAVQLREKRFWIWKSDSTEWTIMIDQSEKVVFKSENPDKIGRFLKRLNKKTLLQRVRHLIS